MTAPDKVLEFVQRFDRNIEAYRSGQYNETQIRREFIDPLFEQLGWDVANKQGYAEAGTSGGDGVAGNRGPC